MKKVKGLLVMDVDSTLIMEKRRMIIRRSRGRRTGCKYNRACHGSELDFEEALRERVALLKGLPETVLDTILGRVFISHLGQKNW